jgi:hypothetical protein
VRACAGKQREPQLVLARAALEDLRGIR